VAPKTEELKEPEAPLHTSEPLLPEETDPAEDLQKGEVEPIPNPQVRRFSVDWDPIQYVQRVAYIWP